jgi:DnaK suppressor protein
MMAETSRRTDIDFDEFRERLNFERETLLDLHHVQRADMREEMEDASENELSHTSTFDSAENEDTAVMIAEHDRDEAMDENTQQTIYQIDRALAKLDDGTYGICEVTGKPIPLERLRALPWATTTVEAAAEYEK